MLHNALCQEARITDFIHLYKRILIIEVKLSISKMHHGIFMYIVFHASVKNTLSSAADSLANFEISYHTADFRIQHFTKMFIWRASRQALRSTLLIKIFWYHLRCSSARIGVYHGINVLVSPGC